jgi:hypothetical protein
VDEREAIAGLERTEAALRAWADANGLVVSVDPMWPGAPGPHEQSGPVRHAVWSIAGKLPGGASGRLRHQAIFGKTMGVKVAGQHTIMVCRLPESVGYIPLLCVRPDELGSGLYYWGGDRRPRSEHEFESAELGRRFKVEIAAGQDQNWLYQLFAPTMIDWLAHETPQDFGFKLDGGVFTCECPQWRGQARADGEVDPAYLDLIAQSGGRAAGRIRDEVLEEAGLLERPDGPSAAAHAGFSGARKHGRIVGALLKLATTGMDDGIGDYASERGLEVVDPATFHTRHLTLPFPGTATQVVAGSLPGGREGHLAWLEFSSEVDMPKEYVALVCETASQLPTAWVDAEEIGIGGFGDEIAPAALEQARLAGYGIATAGRTANVYMRTSGTTPGAVVDEFAERASGIAALLA